MLKLWYLVTMKISRSTSVSFLIATGSMLLYALIYLGVYPYLGLWAAAFNMIPAAIFGLLIGVRGGFFYLLIAIPINILLFNWVESPNNELITHFLGISAFTLVSIGIGWMRDLRGLNDQIHKQTLELETERKLLQEEIVRRTYAEEKLVHEALHDPLTDLPNRRLFFNRLEHAYAWSKRNPDNLCAVLFIDLDKFKTINDSMGHEAGDHLLKQVSSRLKSTIRDIDTVARMGGDEFVILLEATSASEDLTIIIQRIQAKLALPYDLQGREIVSGASIGVVMSVATYQQLDDILRDADLAMYYAKASGGNQVKVFDASVKA
jgi:diguanylate cyclase (GGDEF)-like protein